MKFKDNIAQFFLPKIIDLNGSPQFRYKKRNFDRIYIISREYVVGLAVEWWWCVRTRRTSRYHIIQYIYIYTQSIYIYTAAV